MKQAHPKPRPQRLTAGQQKELDHLDRTKPRPQRLTADEQKELDHLDRTKPRPRKLEAELRQVLREDLENLDRDLDRCETPEELADLIGGTAGRLAVLGYPPPRTKADVKRLDAITYKAERETLPAMFWKEALAHLRRGNLTAAHYLLTHPAYLGRFVAPNAEKPSPAVQKELARLGFTSPQDLKARLKEGQAKQRGKVLLEVLQTLAGACCFGEMLALLPHARHALHNAGYDAEDCRQAVALARGAMLHLPPDYTPDADLISLRQRAAGIKTKPTRKPAKAKRKAKLQPF